MATDTKRAAVAEACDRLFFGTKAIPTYDAIREALGNTGSRATIQRWRDEWIADLADRVHHAGQHPDVPEPVWAATQGLWEAACEAAQAAADTSVAEARDAAEAARVDAQAKAEAADRRVEAVEQRATDAAARADAAEATREALSGRLARASEDLATARAQLASTTERRDALEQDVAAATKRIDTITAEAAAERQALSAGHEQDSARWQREVDAARTEARTLGEQLTKLQASHHDLQNKMVSIEGEARILRKQRDTAQADVATLETQGNKVAEQRDAAHQAAQDATAASRTAEGALDTARDEIERLQSELQAEREERRQLRTALDRLTARLESRPPADATSESDATNNDDT